MSNKKPKTGSSDLIAKASFGLASSLGVPLDEKKKLLQRLPELSSEKLKQLIALFAHEEERNQGLLHNFFQNHPELFSQYDHMSSNNVNAVFRSMEEKERKQELQRMREILESK